MAQLPYTFDARRNWALSLAHPLACAWAGSGYAESRPVPAGDLQSWFRPVLLHFFRLQNDMSDAQIGAALTEQLRTRWYCMDLDALHAADDPYAAMAFACARLTFAVRLAALHGWLDEETQWQVLLQNAQRAHDCFESWQDFGNAWSRGRRQWVAHARADSLGVSFDDAQVQAWITDPQHPWGTRPWKQPQIT